MNLSSELTAAMDEAKARVRLAYPWWLRPFLLRGVAAITLGRRIYVSPSYLDRPARDLERLLRHEVTHVRQINELGLVRFLYRYVGEYIRNRRAGLRSHEAYRRISFEMEAHAAEEAV